MPKPEAKETPIAYELAKKQKEISVAEFFTKNRHLLGFDNKRKALLMTVKEAVDNSLDACQEANVLPEINVEIIEMSEFRYKVVIEDNGPGIVKEQIPKVFADLACLQSPNARPPCEQLKFFYSLAPIDRKSVV